MAEDTSSENWLDGLLPSINGVTSLQLQCGAPLAQTFLGFLVKAPKTSFPNLRRILVLILNPVGLRALLKLDKPLSVLKLGRLQGMTAGDLVTFGIIV